MTCYYNNNNNNNNNRVHTLKLYVAADTSVAHYMTALDLI